VTSASTYPSDLSYIKDRDVMLQLRCGQCSCHLHHACHAASQSFALHVCWTQPSGSDAAALTVSCASSSADSSGCVWCMPVAQCPSAMYRTPPSGRRRVNSRLCWRQHGQLRRWLRVCWQQQQQQLFSQSQRYVLSIWLAPYFSVSRIDDECNTPIAYQISGRA